MHGSRCYSALDLYEELMGRVNNQLMSPVAIDCRIDRPGKMYGLAPGSGFLPVFLQLYGHTLVFFHLILQLFFFLLQCIQQLLSLLLR